VFPGSSVVEQPAVNRLVAGSNPARGAKQNQVLRWQAAQTENLETESWATGGATIRKFGSLAGQRRSLARLSTSAAARDRGKADSTSGAALPIFPTCRLRFMNYGAGRRPAVFDIIRSR
jgi:hypothetical protein